MDSRSKLNEYMSRMREMEDKLRESRLQAKFNEQSQLSLEEFEKAEKLRREEDELRHLRELQEEERRAREDVQAQRSRMQYAQQPNGSAVYNYSAELARQKQELELKRLAILREQVQSQEEENRRLQEQLVNSMRRVQPIQPPVYPYYAPYPPQQPYPAAPQQQFAAAPQPTPYPAQIYVTQNFNQPAYNPPIEVQSDKKSDVGEAESDKKSDEAEPRKAAETYVERPIETVVTDNRVTEVVREKPIDATVIVNKTEENTDDEGVSFNERLTFAEAYTLLIDEQRAFCDELRAYAREKSGAKEFPAKYHLSVGNGQKVIVKMTIKNGICFAHFRLEDERLRAIRRNAAIDGAEIKIKETSLPISDDAACRVAKEMIDLRLVQLNEYIALQKQRAAERRRLAKLQAAEE